MEIKNQHLSDTILVHDGNRWAVRTLEAIILKKNEIPSIDNTW